MVAVVGIVVIVAVIGYVLFIYDNGHSGFQRTEVQPRPSETRDEGTVDTVYFQAVDGTQIEGWLFRPHGLHAPLVVMAPGLTGTKEGHLEPFAWRFVRQGIAVLAIDFRTFGGSDGEPRHWVDPFRQVQDYAAAVRFASESLAQQGLIDAARIALWGSSFSGGTAIVAAAEMPAVAAVVAQCPFLDTPPELEPRLRDMFRYVPWVMLDLARVALNTRLGLRLAPVYIPAFGRPGEFAFAASRDNPSRLDGTERGALFWQTLPKRLRGGWENKMLARFLAQFDRFKPIASIASVRCPIYLIAAEADDMVPLRFVEQAHSMLKQKHDLTVHRCGHFDLYVEPVLSQNADLQAAFLAQHLGTVGGDLAP